MGAAEYAIRTDPSPQHDQNQNGSEIPLKGNAIDNIWSLKRSRAVAHLLHISSTATSPFYALPPTYRDLKRKHCGRFMQHYPPLSHRLNGCKMIQKRGKKICWGNITSATRSVNIGIFRRIQLLHVRHVWPQNTDNYCLGEELSVVSLLPFAFPLRFSFFIALFQRYGSRWYNRRESGFSSFRLYLFCL